MDRKIFFDLYRQNLDPNRKLDQSEVDALTTFLNFFERDIKMFSIKQWAYVFATVFHETGATFLPVIEAHWLSEAWRKKNLQYYPYYGRGYVQITWDYNYKAYSKKLAIDLLNNPELSMIPENSWFILVDGFKNGVFTGKKISGYINDKKADYKNARRIINGTDKAVLIASYAVLFESILEKATK